MPVPHLASRRDGTPMARRSITSSMSSTSPQSLGAYRVGSIRAIRAALEPLQAAWPFAVVQHGYVIRFVARWGTAAARKA
ncbi:MAG: hypothetical protein AW10_02989 [Candidatus Accumulibacter appositus]|uniref:Uncharacterized protein n=2 Tax=Candidatus Accumulibacter TaxID=327159 RepID=A0A011PNN6_9PROT|nr:MAG: hypothetical protein AW10_02989 [Candidatus Accumulibacter appositus]